MVHDIDPTWSHGQTVDVNQLKLSVIMWEDYKWGYDKCAKQCRSMSKCA